MNDSNSTVIITTIIVVVVCAIIFGGIILYIVKRHLSTITNKLSINEGFIQEIPQSGFQTEKGVNHKVYLDKTFSEVNDIKQEELMVKVHKQRSAQKQNMIEIAKEIQTVSKLYEKEVDDEMPKDMKTEYIQWLYKNRNNTSKISKGDRRNMLRLLMSNNKIFLSLLNQNRVTDDIGKYYEKLKKEDDIYGIFYVPYGSDKFAVFKEPDVLKHMPANKMEKLDTAQVLEKILPKFSD